MPNWDVLWTPARAVYFVAFTAASSYWRNDSHVVEPYQAAHLPLYSVPATEQRKGVYTASVPLALPEGDWVVLAFDNAGGVPNSTESDADAPAGSGRYQGSGTAEDGGGGGGTVPIQPISTAPSLLNPADPTPGRINVPQGLAPTEVWQGLLNPDSSAQVLTGKQIRFVAYSDDGLNRTTKFSYDSMSSSPRVVVGPAANTVQVTFSATDTALNQTLLYALWNITDSTLLAKGILDIFPPNLQ